jgi:hypothetical protein
MENNSSQNNDPNQQLVISYLALRRGVGIIGIMLPIVLTTGMLVLSKCSFIQPSISDYYYTRVGSFLVGALCAVGLFLFSYKGYDRKDMIAGKLASLFAIAIAFFPTGGPDADSTCNFLHRKGISWVSTVHDISAALFFLTLAYFSLFLFTIKSDNPTPRKLMRNKIYKVCGYTILLCIVLLLLYFKIPAIHSLLKDYYPVFALETIALWAFGISWLTKGDAIMKDK